jgi:hypothetical protein
MIPPPSQAPSAAAQAQDAAKDTIYMLRTVQQHQVQLSTLADSKANTLLSTSFVVLALVVGQLKASAFSLPLLILAVTTLLCASFAVFAVLPRGVSDPVKPDSKQFNPLFFGHFANLEMDEFVARMRTIGSDTQSVHDAMARDIYSIGRLLHDKKYRYLRISYRIFLAGLLATLLGLLYTYTTN